VSGATSSSATTVPCLRLRPVPLQADTFARICSHSHRMIHCRLSWLTLEHLRVLLCAQSLTTRPRPQHQLDAVVYVVLSRRPVFAA
jgi:hypothetical protein